jgi:hypothetical protein
MVQHLRLRWRDNLPIKELLRLRSELDDMLGRIRSTQHIANRSSSVQRVGTMFMNVNSKCAHH